MNQAPATYLLSLATIGRLIGLVAAVGLVVNLFTLGSRPFAADLMPQPWDKLAHLSVYSIIAVLLWSGTAMRWPVAVLAFVVAVGIFNELQPAALPRPVIDAADLLIDFAAGALIGGLLFLYAHPGPGK